MFKDITDLYKQPTTNKVNLSQDEIKALGELKQMKDIVIKSADKLSSGQWNNILQKHTDNSQMKNITNNKTQITQLKQPMKYIPF